MNKVNLEEKFSSFSERWSPKIVARYNQNEVRLAKLEGEFHWHKHDDTDELFLCVDGVLDIELRDGIVTLNPGELFVVPRATEHRPVARTPEAKVLFIDVAGTPNTGDESTATQAVEL